MKVVYPGDIGYPPGVPAYEQGYVVGVGPAAQEGTKCATGCGMYAVAECQACGKGFCHQHWWKHDHSRPDAERKSQ